MLLFSFVCLFFPPLGPWLSLGFSVTGLAVALLSLALWVAVGFHVGLQTST